MKLRKLYFVVFSLFLAHWCQAQTTLQTRALADQFFENQQFDVALYYYQRVAFFSRPQTDPVILSRIGDCFYATGDLTRALEFYDHAYFGTDSVHLKTEFFFAKISTYLELKNYHSALAELLGADFMDGSVEAREKELYLATAYFGLDQFEESGRHFLQAVPPGNLEARNALVALFNNPKNFNRPNPKSALVLSAILPGAGQLYAGDPGAGINSLLLTGTFVALVLYLSARIHPIDAILTGLPWFQRYYQGGFEHAERTAEKERTNRRNKVYQQALKTLSDAQ